MDKLNSLTDRHARGRHPAHSLRDNALIIILVMLVVLPAVVIAPFALDAFTAASGMIDHVQAANAAKDAELARMLEG